MDFVYLFVLGENEIIIFVILDELIENDLLNLIFFDQFCVYCDSCWYRCKQNMFVLVFKVIVKCFGYVFLVEIERLVIFKLIL